MKHILERGNPLLEVKNLTAYYGSIKALDSISFNILDNEIVAMIGPNGAGKSTAIKAVCGLIDRIEGQIDFQGHSIVGLPPNELVKKGISLVPDGRKVFSTMTVLENLFMGGYLLNNDKREANIEKAFSTFPALKDRKNQRAGTLSGGEQQMLAIGRSLMLNPKLLILDEPTLGLSPNYIEIIFEKIKEINKIGTAVIIVEQNVQMALENAHRGYVFNLGKIFLEGDTQDLLMNEEIKKSFLGHLKK